MRFALKELRTKVVAANPASPRGAGVGYAPVGGGGPVVAGVLIWGVSSSLRKAVPGRRAPP